jgi:EAL domain-containing protein (putative c-di-GMP-specific phosphodiesterase class I)
MSEILILPPPSAIRESDTDGSPFVLLPTRDSVERLLALARTHLGMEVGIVSEFTGEEQILRHLEGDPEAFGLQTGARARLTDTYCWRVANGHLPPAIPDARADVRVRDLEATWEADIGSYIGAPIRFSDGRVYGSVCCLSHSANPSFRDRDAEFMTMVAALIGQELEAEWAAHEKRREMFGPIREVLERGGLGVAFRPIFDLDSLAIVGYEALPRFDEGGSPERWFADAEEIGLGADLERAVIQVSLAHLGDLPRGAFHWVSLSTRAMGSSTIRDMLAEAPGDRTIVGLAPTGPGGEPGLVEAAHDLRALGLRLAFDHVGGEPTALSDVYRLQPDVLRLDPGVVRGIDADPPQRDVVSFLVRLGSEVGAAIVVEGIETRETLNVLRDLGVAYGQGYALAPPLSLDDLAHERP